MHGHAQHWAEQYVGIAYARLNCAQLVAHALRQHFGRDDLARELEAFPAHGEGTKARSDAIGHHRYDLSTRVATPHDGAGVVLQVGAKLQHMGLAALIGPRGAQRVYILHTSRKAGAQLQSVERVADQYKVEGFYKWRNPSNS